MLFVIFVILYAKCLKKLLWNKVHGVYSVSDIKISALRIEISLNRQLLFACFVIVCLSFRIRLLFEYDNLFPDSLPPFKLKTYIERPDMGVCCALVSYL